MTDSPPGPAGPADEQRTTALPRRPPPAEGAAPGGPPDARWPGTGGQALPGPADWQEPSNETTVLRRPAGAPGSQPPVSNLPGAARAPRPDLHSWPAPPDPGPAPSSTSRGRRGGDDTGAARRYRGDDAGWAHGYGGDDPDAARGYRGDDPDAARGYRGDDPDAARGYRGDDPGAARGYRGDDDPRRSRGRPYEDPSHGQDPALRHDPYPRDHPYRGEDQYPDEDEYPGEGRRRSYSPDSRWRSDRPYPPTTPSPDDRPYPRDYRGPDDGTEPPGYYRDRDDAAPPRYPDDRRYRRDPEDPDGRRHRLTGDPGSDQPRYRDTRREPAHLPPYREPYTGPDDEEPTPPPVAAPGLGGRAPRKLTVTRVAALRSRELTHRGIERFHGAVSADGADRSGLTHLTYAVMGNYAVDAALAVALANTLFFAAAKAESTGKVLLYLLLTVAPFAIIAPFIGPLLDRIQNGRRIALSLSSFGRAVLALVMAIKFDSWVIYPCALGMLVLSKSFGVLKAALTPRVLPEAITLVKTNSRLSVFGLIAGGVSGGIAAGIAALTGSAGALGFTTAVALVGGWLCLRIPAWVESTAGEVPVQQREQGRKRRVFPREVAGTLWTNGTIRVETGFLALFIAFVVKSEYQPRTVIASPGVVTAPPTDHAAFMQLLLLAAVGAAAGAGGFLGNALGARLPLRAPQTVALVCLGSVLAAVLLAFLVPGLITAGVVALVGSTASSLAKVSLDSVIQHNLPEASRASAFGRSESVLQLCWVFGGVLGLLIGGVWALNGHSVYMVGFGIIWLLLAVGAVQCVSLRMGRSLLPAMSLRGLLHRGRNDTTPLVRPAGPVPDTGVPLNSAQNPPAPAGSTGSAAGRNGRGRDAVDPTARRATRKAGRPR